MAFCTSFRGRSRTLKTVRNEEEDAKKRHLLEDITQTTTQLGISDLVLQTQRVDHTSIRQVDTPFMQHFTFHANVVGELHDIRRIKILVYDCAYSLPHGRLRALNGCNREVSGGIDGLVHGLEKTVALLRWRLRA